VNDKRRSKLHAFVRWAVPFGLGLPQLLLWGLVLGGGMPSVIAWLLLTALPLLGALGLVAGMIYAGKERRLGPLLSVSLLLSLLALWPAAWMLDLGRIAYPASPETTTPAATVRLPSNQPLRVAWGGNDLKTNAHAATADQRWAYDLLTEPYLNGSSNLEDYGCYGTEVVAPISAVVHLAHDGEPDVAPGIPSNPAKPLGNFVSLKLETDTYLVVAHLREGSVSVKAGQRVEEGAPLGRCGNSGNTSEPHIHVHHQRQPIDPLHIGLAEGLPLYFRDHEGAPMPTGGIGVDGERLQATGDVVRHSPGG
jgi:hypothetical protein